jgi:hypothetical protein
VFGGRVLGGWVFGGWGGALVSCAGNATN